MHIGIIADGNGRYGEAKYGERGKGYLDGAKATISLLHAQKTLELDFVSLFIFSKDNFKRSKDEINTIFSTVENYFNNQLLSAALALQIRCKVIGDRSPFSSSFLSAVENLENKTAAFRQTMAFAVNYDGRAEIAAAATAAANAAIRTCGYISATPLTPTDIGVHLTLPPCDIIMRYGNRKRLSGFLTWQSAYSKIYFLEKLFPEFCLDDLSVALDEFNNTSRTFGGLETSQRSPKKTNEKRN